MTAVNLTIADIPRAESSQPCSFFHKALVLPTLVLDEVRPYLSSMLRLALTVSGNVLQSTRILWLTVWEYHERIPLSL